MAAALEGGGSAGLPEHCRFPHRGRGDRTLGGGGAGDTRGSWRSRARNRSCQNLTYTNAKGETFTLPLWQMMAHVPNHNTHHRGELAAMFALMNASHPEEEVVQYFLIRSGQKKD